MICRHRTNVVPCIVWFRVRPAPGTALYWRPWTVTGEVITLNQIKRITGTDAIDRTGQGNRSVAGVNFSCVKAGNCFSKAHIFVQCHNLVQVLFHLKPPQERFIMKNVWVKSNAVVDCIICQEVFIDYSKRHSTKLVLRRWNTRYICYVVRLDFVNIPRCLTQPPWP